MAPEPVHDLIDMCFGYLILTYAENRGGCRLQMRSEIMPYLILGISEQAAVDRAKAEILNA